MGREDVIIATSKPVSFVRPPQLLSTPQKQAPSFDMSQPQFFERKPSSLMQRKSPPPPFLSLADLTQTDDAEREEEACKTKAFVYLADITSSTDASRHSKIPPIIHQTSKSRCLTKLFAKVSKKWRDLDGYKYYLHDDNAVMKLLLSDQAAYDFPLLHQLVTANCLPHGTLKADIWRYLILWFYGGLYADIDSQPTALFNTTQPILTANDDGWFLVEQFHVLSQYVMAVSPRHPLMWYALHHALLKVAIQMDTGRVNAALVTGPHALHRAYQDFRRDAGANVDPQGPGYKPVWAGTFQGTNQRSITVVGKGEWEGQYVTREMMDLSLKKKQYAKMNMTSFRDDKDRRSGKSCLSAFFQYQENH